MYVLIPWMGVLIYWSFYGHSNGCFTAGLRSTVRRSLSKKTIVVYRRGFERLSQSPAKTTAQKIDAEYTAKIKDALQDPRISTELVDHLPASDTVPSPLKFLGR